MRASHFGHHGNDCSFETIPRHYDLTDPLLVDHRRHRPGNRPRRRPV
ncbi:hypothetical protein [Kribbella italica]